MCYKQEHKIITTISDFLSGKSLQEQIYYSLCKGSDIDIEGEREIVRFKFQTKTSKQGQIEAWYYAGITKSGTIIRMTIFND